MATSGPACSDLLPTRPLSRPMDSPAEAEEASLAAGNSRDTGSGELAQQLLAQALLADKSARLQVQGRSMEPLIRDGDRVEILPSGSARCGSVVLALNATGVLVCHRILARTSGSVWLSGDRLTTVDEHAPESVLGVVASVDREGSVLRLDGPWASTLDRIEARLHLFSSRRRGSLARRLPDAIRRALLELRGLAWSARSAARRAKRVGTSCLFRPASSR